MDFWAETQGHLPQYNKFNTVPSRSFTQNYHDRQVAPQFPVFYGDQQHKTNNPGYWTSRDLPNWTNQETTNMTSPQNFPFSFGHPIQRHYSDVGEQQRQEARDWAIYHQQERGMQCDGWSFNPSYCKRDLTKKNESNFRELEAWALRYSHSLPRRKRIEAELRGSRQDNVERRDMQMLNTHVTTQWGRASRQQGSNYCQPLPVSPGFDVKNKLSYQTKLLSRPPNYNAPPSYNVQFRSVLKPQKIENQCYKLHPFLKHQEQEMIEKYPSKVVTQEFNALQVNRQFAQDRPSNEAAKVIEGRKFKLNKKAGGMTIFCLVSRIADTEYESLPLLQKDTEVVEPKCSNKCQPMKLADEVDFKVQTSTKQARSPHSKLHVIPICKESLSKMAEKNMPKTNEVYACEKLAVQSKYPLWRRPSFTSNSGSNKLSATCLKDTLGNNLEDTEHSTISSCKIDKENMQEAKDDAMLMIDTTCVIVKLEVLQGPKKEQVQYLSSEKQSGNGLNLADEAMKESPANQPVIEQGEDLKILLEQEAKSNDVDKAKSEDIYPVNSECVSETLEKDRKRCVGRDCASTQLQKNFDLRVEECPKKNNDTKRDTDRTETHNVSTIIKNIQLEQESICKDEVTSEVGVSKDNTEENGKDLETDNEPHNSKMAHNLKEETNGEEGRSGHCEEPGEINVSMDVLNNLALSKEERDNKVQPIQHECPLQINRQNGEKQVELNEDTKNFVVHEKNTIQCTFIEKNITILSHDIDFTDKDQDQEATEKVSEGYFNQENMFKNISNHELAEVLNPEPASSQRDHVFCSDSEINSVKDIDAMAKTDSNNILQMDSGQTEDMPDLKILSESEQDQDKQQTEEAKDETRRSNIVEPELEPKDEVSCIKEGGKNCDKDMEETSCNLEIQGIAENVIEDPDLQNRREIMVASSLKNVKQKTQLHLTNNLMEHFKFGCLEKGLVKKEEHFNEDDFEKTSPSVNVDENQGNEKPHVTDPRKELEDFAQSQNKDVKVNVNKEGQTDQATTKDRMENDQEEDKICAKKTKLFEEILEKADILENICKDEIIEMTENYQVQEITDATCLKEQHENITFLEADNGKTKEPESQKDTELMGQILVQTGITDASDSRVQASNLQQCGWEDATSECCVSEKELVQENEKSDQDIKLYKSTNRDKDDGETIQVCHPDPSVNNHTAILERSSTSTDVSHHSSPSTSMCDNNFENSICEEEGKCPKSLWDAVNRIRKHTAPDSENEEEEMMDNWDRESLSDSIFSFENVFDKGYVDLEDLNAQDDKLSQYSDDTQESDGTVVDDLEELTNMDLKAICNDNRGTDDRNKLQNRETVNKNGQNEEKLDEEAEIPNEIML